MIDDLCLHGEAFEWEDVLSDNKFNPERSYSPELLKRSPNLGFDADNPYANCSWHL